MVWVLFSLFLGTGIYADSLYQLGYLNGTSESYAEGQFESFGDLMAQSLNTGMGDLLSSPTFRFGAQVTMMPVEKEGVMQNSSYDALYLPNIYVSVKISNVNAFWRYLYPVFSVSDSSPSFWGMGAAYRFDFSELLSLAPGLTFHKSSDIEGMSIYSLGLYANGVVDLKFMKPFFNLGLSRTAFDTDVTLNNGEKFDYSSYFAHLSLGLQAFGMVYEMNILPYFSHNIGFSKNF